MSEINVSGQRPVAFESPRNSGRFQVYECAYDERDLKAVLENCKVHHPDREIRQPVIYPGPALLPEQKDKHE